MSASRFCVGEVAVLLVGCEADDGVCTGSRCFCAGDDVTIVGALGLRPMTIDGELQFQPCYVIDGEARRTGCHGYYALPHELRKKRPPGGKDSALDCDEAPNAPGRFDPAIWAPAREVA